MMGLEIALEAILDEFPLDTSSVVSVDSPGLDEGSKVFEVDVEASPLIPSGVNAGRVFIVDSSAMREVACHPSIVGAPLEGLCLEGAEVFSRAFVGLRLFDVGGSAVLHILRGAAGYRVADALPVAIPVISVRTEYREAGYRAHTDDARDISVTYRDYPVDLRLERVSTLIVPDTFATGRSAEAALLDLMDSGLEPERIILYGFMAVPALTKLGALCKSKGVEMVSFAICDLTQLAHNNYDMPLYGFDESLHASQSELGRLGSVVSLETLRGMLPLYVAGMDQPGDWSERQRDLFNGLGNEAGDIKGHLSKSIGLVESLREINSGQGWYDEFHDEIAARELARLREALK